MKNVSVADILSLDVEERLTLVQAVWDSIADAPETLPLSDEERAVLDERLDAHYKTPGDSSPWAEVRARITGK